MPTLSPLPASCPNLTGLDSGTQQYVKSLWMAEDYDEHYSYSTLFKLDAEFLDRLFPKPLRLIDLGCGTGRHLVPFARRGFDVTGVDLSDHMLRVTAGKLAKAGLHARLVKSNLCRMDALEDSSFDAAICMFSTLGMIRGSGNRLACVREVFRLLRPGGTFTVHCHNFLFGGYLPETWLEWAKSLGLALLHGYELGDKLIPEYRGVPNMYLHLFTPGEVGRLLSASGLRVVRIAYINRGRTAELGPVMFRSLRANGFVAVSRKPEMG